MPLKKTYKLTILFFIHVTAFVITALYKNASIEYVLSRYLEMLLYLGVTFFSSLILGKLRDTEEKSNFLNVFKKYFNSFILSTGLLSILFISTHYLAPSRLLIAGTLFLSFLGEVIFIYLNYRLKFERELRLHIKFTVFTFLYLSGVLATLTIYVYIYLRPSLFANDKVLIGLMVPIWFFSSFFVHQFSDFFKRGKFWKSFYSLLRGGIIFVLLTAFATFMLQYDFNFSLMVFIISIVYTIGSLFLFGIIYLTRAPEATDEVRTKFLRATPEIETEVVEKIEERSEKYGLPNGNPYSSYLAEQLGTIYLKKYANVFRFIDESLDLTTFDIRRAVMIRSADTYNVDVLPLNSFELYLNLHEMNDIRRLNRYFIEINSKLIYGGVFIGRIEPVNLRFERYAKSYPYYVARLFYFFDFIWKRIFPKLPFLQKVYFAVTQGKSRAISLAECLGRLYYCGFSVVNLREINNHVYFIVKKIEKPKTDLTPSYGPLIKLKRSGKGGKRIFVYKLRTMHPYSEYLQKFVFDIGNLSEGGKFKDDFRITNWGRVFRKLWLDELPMFINFFKGELKIVGVRPLSEQYLSLYPEEFRERRKKYKPGLVPPFYHDMPNTLEEIIDSERKYLDAYDKSPIITDVKYFISAVKNIVFKKARSK